MKIQGVRTAFSTLKEHTTEILSRPVQMYKIYQYNRGSLGSDCFGFFDKFSPMSMKRAILKLISRTKN